LIILKIYITLFELKKDIKFKKRYKVI
jgi:hypothetical protein